MFNLNKLKLKKLVYLTDNNGDRISYQLVIKFDNIRGPNELFLNIK